MFAIMFALSFEKKFKCRLYFGSMTLISLHKYISLPSRTKVMSVWGPTTHVIVCANGQANLQDAAVDIVIASISGGKQVLNCLIYFYSAETSNRARF